MTDPALHIRCDSASGPLHMRIDQSLSANWTVLFGPSGSGKSTLLRLISGLWSPEASAVRLKGTDVTRLPSYRRGIALVSQQPALFPHLTVQNNVAFGGKASRSHTELVLEILSAFELEHLRSKYPASLSGGEGQRVAIARAIASRPRLLLLDEAFTGMQRTQQERLIDMVRTYSRNFCMPVLSVTHDVAEAFFCGDEVLRIDAGQIVARGSAKQVLAEERTGLLRSLGGLNEG